MKSKKSYFYISIDLNGKNVLNDSIQEYGKVEYEIIDFNHDGNGDLKITYPFMRKPDSRNFILYLFNSSSKKFELIKNFVNYNYVTHLKDNYFVAYYEDKLIALHGGKVQENCLDLNWYSPLLKINNSELILEGYIEANGCTNRNISDYKEILIYRVKENNELKSTLVEKLQYDKKLKKINNRKKFIREYWLKNGF